MFEPYEQKSVTAIVINKFYTLTVNTNYYLVVFYIINKIIHIRGKGRFICITT